MLRIALLTAVAAVAAGPPASLFEQGYNLCHAAPLAAIRSAGGQRYRPGLFVNKTCLWERADLKAGVTLSTHPSSAGRRVMRQLLSESGKAGFTAKRIHIRGAQSAVLVTLSHTLTTASAKDLLASYPNGVVQVNMSAPRTLPDARLVAVLKAVTGAG